MTLVAQGLTVDGRQRPRLSGVDQAHLMYVLPFHEFMAMEEWQPHQNLRPRPCACRIEMCVII